MPQSHHERNSHERHGREQHGPGRAAGRSISIPPARTPPDDRPEDYPTELPHQPPMDRCALGPVNAPAAHLLWAVDGLAEVARLAVLRPRTAATRHATAQREDPQRAEAARPDRPSLVGPATAGPTEVAEVAGGPWRSAFAPGLAGSRQLPRYAGAAMMSTILAEGQIMEVSDVLAASPVQLALERADDLLHDLIDAHERTPPAHILAQTARLRRGLERLSRRSVPHLDAHRRDLLAGQVAVLGADAAFKLGDVRGARTLTTLGFQAGRRAGDGPLRGSAREIAAVTEFYAGHPDEALRLAQDGLTHTGDGPIGARLTCQIARALAALGDVRGAAQALDAAYDLADLIPPDQWGRPGPGFDTFHPVEVPYYATTTLCLLGRPRAAQEHADLAMPKLDAMDVPGFRSVIRLDLALALARQGRLELDRVCTLATEAIEISWGRTVSSVSRRADELLIATRPHSEVREVREAALLVREWQRSAADQQPAPGAVTAPNPTP